MAVPGGGPPSPGPRTPGGTLCAVAPADHPRDHGVTRSAPGTATDHEETMSSPEPIPELIVHDGPADLARRLRSASGDIVVVAERRVAPAVTTAVRRAFAEALAATPAAGMVAGLVTDPDTGEAWPVPAGLTVTGHLRPAVPPPAEAGPTFVPGPVWAARRRRLAEVGGIDATLPEPYATIDLAWRLWLSGPTVLVDPSIRVPGPPSAPPAPTGPDAVTVDLEAMALVGRNLGGHRREQALRLARVLSPTRLALLHPEGDPHAAIAAFDVVEADVRATNERRQALRSRPDVEIVQLLGDALAPDLDDPTFRAAHSRAVEELGGLTAFTGRWRVAILTADTITAQLAGPAIRAHRIASELSRHHDVRLVSLVTAELEHTDFEISRASSDEDLAELIGWCDVLLYQGPVLPGHPLLESSDAVIVVDMYDPFHLEQLEQGRGDDERTRRHSLHAAVALLNEQFLRGDFFLCASDKQRDFWLGTLAALGRVNPATYEDDPSLEALLAVVPFGVSDEPPVRSAPAIKGVIPGIGVDDQVVLWGGGVYNWFDPVAVIRAVDRLKDRVPGVRLVFLGMRHPNPNVPEMRIADECRRVAGELGLEGRHVFFNDGWVPFDERHNWFLDADVAVTTHFHHVETEFSFRTRVLDYLWAGLPTVSTSGDSLSDLIEREGLGRTVPPDDVRALEDALHELLTDAEAAEVCRRNIAGLVEAMRWSEVLRPLVSFCEHPHRAPDLMEGFAGITVGPPLLRPRFKPSIRTLRARVRRELGGVKRHLLSGRLRGSFAALAGQLRAVFRRWR
jgi:hypothetical protein